MIFHRDSIRDLFKHPHGGAPWKDGTTVLFWFGMLCEGKTILVRQPQKRPPIFWKMPGGKIEDGETIVQAGIREVDEETGIDLTGQSFEEPVEFPQNGPNGRYTQYLLTVHVPRHLFAAHDGKLVEVVDEEQQKIESTCFNVADLGKEPEFMPKHLKMLSELAEAA